jgi:hypothetical protein
MAPSTVFLLVILCIALLRVSRRLYRMGPQANRNTRNRSDIWEQVSADCGSKTIAGSSAIGHPMLRRINVTMQRALRLDPPVW